MSSRPAVSTSPGNLIEMLLLFPTVPQDPVNRTLGGREGRKGGSAQAEGYVKEQALWMDRKCIWGRDPFCKGDSELKIK